MDFTIASVGSFPPWPPQRRVVIGRWPVSAGAGAVELVGHPDGHIEVVVYDQGVPSALHFSRISRSDHARLSIIIVRRSPEQPVQLWINGGEPLKLLSDSGVEEVRVADGGAIPIERSYEVRTAAEECAERMAIRKRRMTDVEGRAVKSGRRRKTSDEEAVDLGEAIARLSHDLERAREGVKAATGGVAGHIRALTYWPNERWTWNPLLLRIAARLDLPLPVYVAPPVELPEAVGLLVDEHVADLLVSCRKLRPTMVIVDLEDYLDRTMESRKVRQGETSVAVGEAVASVASSGYAHYDQDVEEFEDRLRALQYLEVGVLDRVIVTLGEAVLELSRWVAMQGERNRG